MCSPQALHFGLQLRDRALAAEGVFDGFGCEDELSRDGRDLADGCVFGFSSELAHESSQQFESVAVVRGRDDGVVLSAVSVERTLAARLVSADVAGVRTHHCLDGGAVPRDREPLQTAHAARQFFGSRIRSGSTDRGTM